MAVHKRLNGIPATAREPQGEEDTPEKLEEERLIAQEFIDNGEDRRNCSSSAILIPELSGTT